MPPCSIKKEDSTLANYCTLFLARCSSCSIEDSNRRQVTVAGQLHSKPAPTHGTAPTPQPRYFFNLSTEFNLEQNHYCRLKDASTTYRNSWFPSPATKQNQPTIDSISPYSCLH